MSLAHVLLTSLLEKPSTGIALARRFDQSMGYFWHATHQQIYRELKRMLQLGWIEPLSTLDSDSRKITYQVQPQGIEELKQWIITQSPPYRIRDELMVKLRAEAQLGGRIADAEVARHLALHRAQLQIYLNSQHKDTQRQHHVSQRTFQIQQKILELGIIFERGWIQWLEEMQQLLERP